MAMTTAGNQGPNEMMFLWQNQPWGHSNSDDSGKGKERQGMTPSIQKEGGNGREALLNRKRKEIAGGSGKNVTGGASARKAGKRRESDHEIHILTERERRKKMRNMFASLHALLPHLPSKADKSTIVDEAVNHIKNLQQSLEELEKQKQERLQSVATFGCEKMINSQWYPYDPVGAYIAHQGSSNDTAGGAEASNKNSDPPKPLAFQTWSSPNVVLNICGGEAQFCICGPKKPGLMTTIAFVLEKHRIDVISASILCNCNGNTYMIQAHANKPSYQSAEAKSVEATYKQAAEEIMMWIP